MAGKKVHILLTHPADKAIWGKTPCGAKGWNLEFAPLVGNFKYAYDRAAVTCRSCLLLTEWDISRYLKCAPEHF